MPSAQTATKPIEELDVWTALSQCPVYSSLSETSLEGLKAYLNPSSARTQQVRSRRMVEFFKSIDWLPLKDIRPNPLKQLPTDVRTVVQRDIDHYLSQKKEKKQQKREQQKDYRLRVMTYFKTHVSSDDKRFLEALRDYELDHTGQDANWQHYFRFKSYKQIDEFIALSTAQRQGLIDAFMRDVQSRTYHEKKLQEGQYWGFFKETTSLDEEACFNENAPASKKTSTESVHQKALSILELSPPVSKQSIRQQFRKLTQRYHPDKPTGSASKMKALLWAYDTLR